MSTAVAKNGKANSPKELSNFLSSLKSQMELALPKHMSADRMCRLALTAFSSTPKLQDCTVQSIAACVMMSSQLGLEIGVNGQAYMIPYGNTATFVPGWKGLIDLVNRAGRASVWTGAVFEGDFFEWELGSEPFVIHRPAGECDPNKMLFAYACGKVKGSDVTIIECWPNDRIKKHFKKQNKVGKAHYANQHWEMYARKIVLLQVLKYLPQSVELTEAVEAQHASEKVVDGVAVAPAISNLDQLTSRLESTPPAEPKPETEVEPESPASMLDELADELATVADSVIVDQVRVQYIESATSKAEENQVRDMCKARYVQLEGGEK